MHSARNSGLRFQVEVTLRTKIAKQNPKVIQHFHPVLRQLPKMTGFAALALLAAVRALPADASSLAAARQLHAAGRYPEAKAAWEPIAAAEPQNAEAAYYLGATALRLNRPDEAVKLLEKATALDGTRSPWFQTLGDAYGAATQQASFFAKGRWAKKCLAAYDRAVAIDPDNVDARVARMGYYWHVPAIAGGSMGKAYAEAAEIRKRDPVRGAQAFADLYAAEKRYDEAFAIIDDLIARHPDQMPAKYQLGRLAAITGRNLGRGAAALEAYLQYSPKPGEPEIPAAHWRLGMVHEKRGDQAAARAEYEAVLRLAPDFTIARDALARLPGPARP